MKKVLFVFILLFAFAGEVHANAVYEVKKGDTLSKIAKIHKVTVQDLKNWNKLTKDNLTIKQKLVVQKPKTSTPIVKKPVEKEKPAVQKDYQLGIPNVSPAISVSSQTTYPLLVDFAYRLEGIPYKYGGNTMAGFDCSGFIYFIHSQAGVELTRKSSEDYYKETVMVIEPIPGDLVFFQNTYKEGISHMGIYLGENKFIHAGTKGIEVTSIDNVYWQERFVSFNRFQHIQ